MVSRGFQLQNVFYLAAAERMFIAVELYAVLLKSKFWWRLDEHRCTARAAPITERTVQHHAALLHDRFRSAPSDLHPRST